MMDLKKIILLGGVGLVSAAVGVLLPTLTVGHTPGVAASSSPDPSHDAKGDHDASSGGHEPKKDAVPPKPAPAPAKAAAHGSDHGGHGAKGEETKVKEGPCFLEFGRLVINLNEPQLVRFLSVEIAIQTDAKYEEEVQAALDATKPRLKTWLTSHLADKTIDDIRGKVGVNRLRREIQDNFNSMLFKDGHERVQDILFEEFHVQ